MTPFGVGFLYGLIVGASVALALVLLAVYVRRACVTIRSGDAT